MSFFDNTKTVGNLFLLMGIIAIVIGVLNLFISEDGDFSTEVQTAGILMLVSGIICGAIYVIYGLDVKKGSARIHIGKFFDDLGSRYGVLCGMIAVVGLTDLISGILSLSALTIVLAIIVLIMAYLMVDDKKGLSDKIIWIILVIFTILILICSLISILAIYPIVYVLLAIVILVFLFSPEVKEKMGV